MAYMHHKHRAIRFEYVIDDQHFFVFNYPHIQLVTKKIRSPSNDNQ
jgi:hypothetical protein